MLNRVWSFLRPCLQTSRFPLKRVKDSPPFSTSEMSQIGLFCYLGLNSSRSSSINVNKTRKYFSRNIHGARMFSQCFPVSHGGNIVSRCKLCLLYTAGNFNESPSIWALAKILRARASEHSSNFPSNSSKRQNFEHFQIGWGHSIALIVTLHP